jgi:hypothetical protein
VTVDEGEEKGHGESPANSADAPMLRGAHTVIMVVAALVVLLAAIWRCA